MGLITSTLINSNDDFYVYKHLDIDLNCFYVGKGLQTLTEIRNDKYYRANHYKTRSAEWKAIADKGYTVVIYAKNLSHEESLRIEDELIDKYGIDNLTNKIKSRKK